MSRRFALKRLTASDLTFFQWHHDHLNAGNQKAINLNADVFAEQLFPRLHPGSHKIGLSLIGPGNTSPLRMTRKILKRPGYKNWRLNGETVDKEPDRFQVLRADDYALMMFDGEHEPEDLTIVLVAKALDADSHLHRALARLIPATGRKSMIALSPSDVQAIAEEGRLAADHFMRVLVVDEDLIEAAAGIDTSVRQVLSRRGRHARIDKETLQKARAQGEATGELGESLVDLYLDDAKRTRKIVSYTWLARINAISPMDFEASSVDGGTESIEVKTTTGEFKRPFHVAMSELREAAYGDRVYRIYRVFQASAKGAKLRVSGDFGLLARTILESMTRLPAGVLPDGVTIEPRLLSYGKVIRLKPGE